jgi:cysteine desulfuration protein SufE
MEGDNLIFQACSDAIITKGLVSLVVRTLSGHTPREILDAELSFVDEIGLKEHLSPTRSNGLVSMIKKIKLYALAFQTKLNG